MSIVDDAVRSRAADRSVTARLARSRSAPKRRPLRPGAPASDSVLFRTDERYVDRQTKARYVWQKYKPILSGATILDVGADQCYLKTHLDAGASYWGIGLGGQPDQQIDLEKQSLPFENNSYDCVLCLDVLEHLENTHAVFDELCRVANHNVIISLPNPWKDFWQTVRKQPYRAEEPLKYYGLPIEKTEDRHRWFFGPEEARRFIQHRATKCGMRVIQMDDETEGRFSWPQRLRQWWQTLGLRRSLDYRDLYAGTLWAVLSKENQPE